MTILVDTSAFFAGLNLLESSHVEASAQWASLRLSRGPLVTTNYVLVEIHALVRNRLGVEAARSLQIGFVPLLSQVYWVDEPLHDRAVASLLTANRRDLSLVDCVSFEAMREHGLTTAFAFDAHFAEQGFQVIPAVAPR
jgi:predicted nucleic acid-binding protein